VDGFLALLQKDDRFKVEKTINGTSVFKMRAMGIDAAKLLERLRAGNIILPQPAKDTGSLWMTVNTSLNRISPEELADSFVRAAGI
jgi:hypothetical protein